MSEVEVEIKERFEGWGNQLLEAEAEPIVVLGLGPEGMLVLTLEDVTDEELLGIFGRLAQKTSACAFIKRLKESSHGQRN